MSEADLRGLGHVDTWIFDLDNTLYPPSVGLTDQMGARIRQYLAEFFGLDEQGARARQAELCRDHGTTLRGLMAAHGVDPADFMAREYDIDYAALRPAPRLTAALAALPGRAFVHTNSVAGHTRVVLDRIGAASRFEAVFDLFAAELVPKPHPDAYRRFVDRHGIDPARAVMVDDLRHNLEVPHAMGMRTIWVDHHGRADSTARSQRTADWPDFVTSDLAGLLDRSVAVRDQR
ncbi:pyrimidine 5'-nucleotidase [Catellatospora tritici]|uniref:pyrimidine 5'-nucleotidase n=1 Tax=Catellatospora tritici TaxID=2851566 RepID=UPI001C2D9B7E|nr:pyrimidine 5'-nucleotidase [Catellatospora tritici]MBV1854792.1 pyrimidine 5'-nucleotidase [Catellatospora tritici]